MTNLAFNGEVKRNLPLVLGFAVAFHPGRCRWRPELFLAGAMPALDFLLKQPAGIRFGATMPQFWLRSPGRGPDGRCTSATPDYRMTCHA